MTLTTTPLLVAVLGGCGFWLAARFALPPLARLYERRAGLLSPVWHQHHLLDALAASLVVGAMLALPVPEAAALALVCFSLYAATRFDHAMQIIPDALQVIGCSGAVLWRWQVSGLTGTDGLWAAGLTGLAWATGLATCSYAYERWRGARAMGLGDVKLVAWLAIVPGIDPPLLLAGSFVAAWLWIIPRLARRHLKIKETFAFGPCLALAATIQIIGWLTGGPSWGL